MALVREIEDQVLAFSEEWNIFSLLLLIVHSDCKMSYLFGLKFIRIRLDRVKTNKKGNPKETSTNQKKIVYMNIC